MKFNIKQFIVKNKNPIIAICICSVVFAAAFFSGGDLSSNSEIKQAIPTAATSGTAAYTAASAVDMTNAENDEQNNTTTSVERSTGGSQIPSAAASSEVLSNSDKTTANSSNVLQSSTEKDYSSSTEKSESSNTVAAQDKYKTDPTPTDKPQPVEPQEATTTDESLYCTFTITCETILNNVDNLDEDKIELIPDDGIIFDKQRVEFTEGESVYTVLVRVCKENGIHLESTQTPAYNTAYIEGIANIYEFDCGTLSGWTYKVNGWVPNYGCSRYQLEDGDDVVWCYTCDLGNDVGGTGG